MLLRPRDGRRKEGGFTLIELLVVIVIIGVLAAVVLLAVGAFQDRGQLAACKADVKSVEVAVEAYRSNEEHYPANLTDLIGPPENYLRELPNTTANTGEYWITYESSTGTVEGRLKSNEVCAGALAMPAPTGSSTTAPGGGGNPTTTPTGPGGGNPTTTTTTPGGVTQPPGFPLTIQPESMVSQTFQDTLCGDWGDFLGGSNQEWLDAWTSPSFSIPTNFTGNYQVTVRVDSNRSVNGLRLRYRNGTSGSWTTVTTWNVANGCNQTFTATINFTTTGTKQIELGNNNWGNNNFLLLDSVTIAKV